jgi:hypothetical protein
MGRKRFLFILLLSLAWVVPVVAQQGGNFTKFNDDAYLSKLIYNKNAALHIPAAYYGGSLPQYQITQQKGKYGVFDIEDSLWFAPPEYDTITATANYRKGSTWGNLLYGKRMEEYRYENLSYFIITKNGKQGVMAADGTTAIEPQFDFLLPTAQPGLFITQNGCKYGFISAIDKNVNATPQFDHVSFIKNYWPYNDVSISRDCIITYKNKVKQLYTPTGLPYNTKAFYNVKKGKEYQNPDDNRFDTGPGTISFPQDRLIYLLNGRYGLEDHNRKELMPNVYKYINALPDGNFIVSQNNLYGLANHDGKITITPQFVSLEPLSYDSQNALYVANTDAYRKALYTPTGEKLQEGITEIFNDEIRTTVNDSGQPVIWISMRGVINTGVSYSVNGSPMDVYQYGLLKYENGKLAKVISVNDRLVFFKSPENSNIIRYNDGKGTCGLYNLTTGNYTKNLYARITEGPSGTFLASQSQAANQTDVRYTLRLGKSFTESPLPLPVTHYNSGTYIAVDTDGMHLMDTLYKKSAFRYQKIEPLHILSQNDGYEYRYNPKLQNALANYYKYYTPEGGTKYGVIDKNGNILIKAGVYDKVTFPLNAYTTYNYAPKQKVMDRYLYKILLAEVKTAPNPRIDVYANGKKLATLPYSATYKFSYSSFTQNNQMVVNAADSIYVYNLATQKTDLKLPAAKGFSERPDGTFESTQTNNNGKKNIIKTYLPDGRYAGDRFANDYTAPTFKNGKYGVSATDGSDLVPFVHDTLYMHHIYPENTAAYIGKRNNNYGALSALNQVLLPFEYQSIVNVKKEVVEYSRIESRYFFNLTKNGKYGLATNNLKAFIPAKQDTILFNFYTIIAKKGTDYRVYGINGNFIFTCNCESFKYQNQYYSCFKNGLESLLDLEGNQLLPPLFKKATYYSDAIIALHDDGNYYRVNGKGKKMVQVSGYLLKTTSVIKPVDSRKDFFEIVTDTLSGLYSADNTLLLPVMYRRLGGVYMHKFVIVQSNVNNLWGVVDLNNKVVIPLIYRSVSFNEYQNYFEAESKKHIYIFSPEGILLEDKKW